ncbi:hypothetical protein [Butyrivibrio sp.]|uniref:hypothetical protein n=1 Tax=Butyrivibrio sp. TaxID=28121 RepID=UPI0025C1C1E7|nr:hypothetical protein [Butyrivibrio sp.]MBQ9302013.1 hypothetical protein [Butyrivibrio sp.]
MFTPEQIGAFIIAATGFALTVLNLVDKTITLKKNANVPQKLLEERIKVLEVKVEEHDRSLQSGRDEFREQRETNEVLLTCMLALVDFELSYCSHTNYDEDTTDLMKAKDTLRKHLAHR